MYISTLEDSVPAMGGQLVITVVFPEGRVQIDQFKKLREEKQPQKRCPYDSGSSHNSHETLRRQTAVESYPAKKGSMGTRRFSLESLA